MKTDTAIRIAQHGLSEMVEAHAERALAEIRLHASVAQEQIRRKAEHSNRSAGQRRRYAKTIDNGN